MKEVNIADEILKKYSYPLSRDIKRKMKISMEKTLQKILQEEPASSDYYDLKVEGSVKDAAEENFLT